MRIHDTHPALPGHFPGHPVVPGVVLLDAVVNALPDYVGAAVSVTGFPSVKFLAPLGPGGEFTVQFTPKRDGQASFAIRSEEATLVTGAVSYLPLQQVTL